MRPIDADELKKSMDCDGAVKYGNDGVEQTERSYSTLMRYEIADYIDDAPTLDVVDVIRCKDCKNVTLTSSGEVKYCRMFDSDDGLYLSGNFYCAYGERRKE